MCCHVSVCCRLPYTLNIVRALTPPRQSYRRSALLRITGKHLLAWVGGLQGHAEPPPWPGGRGWRAPEPGQWAACCYVTT